jgi:hypothetical protein
LGKDDNDRQLVQSIDRALPSLPDFPMLQHRTITVVGLVALEGGRGKQDLKQRPRGYPEAVNLLLMRLCSLMAKADTIARVAFLLEYYIPADECRFARIR